MKKVYEKPQIYMERIELSQNIALCDYQLEQGDPNSCAIKNDRFDADGGDLKGGFISEKICAFETSVYCYSDGSGTLPSIFVS